MNPYGSAQSRGCAQVWGPTLPVWEENHTGGDDRPYQCPPVPLIWGSHSQILARRNPPPLITLRFSSEGPPGGNTGRLSSDQSTYTWTSRYAAVYSGV